MKPVLLGFGEPRPRTADAVPLLLDNREAAAYCGFSDADWSAAKAEGLLPKPRRVGGRLRYLRATLDKWAAELPLHTTHLPNRKAK